MLKKPFKKLEEVMSNKTFAHTVLVKDEAHIIREIDCVETAIAFLDRWPHGRRGPIFGAAHRACLFAREGRIPVDVASNAFASFARSAKILHHEPMSIEPWMVVPKGKGRLPV